MNCILQKKAENEKQVIYSFYPTDTDVPEGAGMIVIDKKEKHSKITQKPKADEGCNVSLYSGLAHAVASRLIQSGNYPEKSAGAW